MSLSSSSLSLFPLCHLVPPFPGTRNSAEFLPAATGSIPPCRREIVSIVVPLVNGDSTFFPRSGLPENRFNKRAESTTHPPPLPLSPETCRKTRLHFATSSPLTSSSPFHPVPHVATNKLHLVVGAHKDEDPLIGTRTRVVRGVGFLGTRRRLAAEDNVLDDRYSGCDTPRTTRSPSYQVVGKRERCVII